MLNGYVRWIVGGVLSVLLMVTVMLVKDHYARLVSIEARSISNSERLAHLESLTGPLDDRLTRIEDKIDRLFLRPTNPSR